MCFGLFKKKIKVSGKDLIQSICYLYPKRKTNRLKINTKLFLPNDCKCVFAYQGVPYEVFKEAGEYELNGNSLPKLFKAGKFNRIKKNNKVSPFFKCHIYFIPNRRNQIDCEIKNFKFKDYEYGKQKATFRFNVNFEIVEHKEFMQTLLSNFGILSNKTMAKNIEKLFLKTFKKWLHKHSFTFSDIVQYTKGYNEELCKILAQNSEKQGMSILSVSVTDVFVKEEIMREIRETDKVASNIEKKLKKQNFTISVDGVEIEKKMQMNSRYKINSLKEKYVNKANGIEVKKDNSEYVVTTLAGNRDEFGNEIKENKKVVGKYCLYCGKLIPTDSTYCPYCANICGD